jgi:hypothetical protein
LTMSLSYSIFNKLKGLDDKGDSPFQWFDSFQN